MQIVIYILLNYINSSVSQDTNYDIAKCLLLNVRKLHKYSLDDMAELCSVSPSTLKRFCNAVGFHNFSSFKQLLKDHELPFDYESFIENHSKGDYLDKMYLALQDIENIPEVDFLKISKLIERAEHIYLLGFGDYYYPAGYLQNVMLYHRKMFEIKNQCPSKVEKQDLLLVTSLSGEYVKKIQEDLHELNCHKVLIVNREVEENGSFDLQLEIGQSEDKNLNKYILMRVFERLASSYYVYKRGQNLDF